MDIKDNNEQLNEYIKEEQEMNKKSNTFNLIIGLSTLIIAILGASFAYFTMTNGSAENEIAVKSSYVSIAYEGGTKVEADDLIPTNENVMLWAYQERIKETYEEEGVSKTFQCIDAKNRKVCYVYQFTVRSDGEGDTTDILGTITVNINEFIDKKYDEDGNETIKSDLSYMVFELTESEEGETVYKKVSGSEVASVNQKDIEYFGENIDSYKFTRFGIPREITSTDEEGNETTTTETVENYLFGSNGHIDISNGVDHIYQLVIWLHDDGYDQNFQQAKNFAGTIKVNVTSGDNSGIVTGTKDNEETSEENPDDNTSDNTGDNTETETTQ